MPKAKTIPYGYPQSSEQCLDHLFLAAQELQIEIAETRDAKRKFPKVALSIYNRHIQRITPINATLHALSLLESFPDRD